MIPLTDKMEAVSTLLVEEGPIKTEKEIKRRLRERGYEPFDPHVPLMYLRTIGAVGKHGVRSFTFYANLRFPSQLLPIADTARTIEYRKDIVDTLRELADWVEESIGEPESETEEQA